MTRDDRAATTRSDDLGDPVPLPGEPRRIVSLVPSITEALATDVPERLVGATDWCTHPADLDVTRVRGTKNPDLRAIRSLEPDLVVANKEENRALDVRRLRDAGVPVWVTDIETVPQALDSLDRLYEVALQATRPDWLATARARWDVPPPPARGRVVVPIWRDPWMVVGPRTYTGDLLRRLGWTHVYDAGEDRYPAVDLAAIDRPDVDLVLLPDEPYVFTEDDGPEAFTQVPTRLVSGRLLTWYGPAMVEAYDVLSS
ncbi:MULTISPECIES: helical backbone metal receptor [unclassified Nocardioides]|uniref:helical backbone metal receptor n=1 Tax=unclassified Nocardioides TaxID=2615069 RepID=UPI0006F7956D|nr:MULTISPECIES: helical backbone metal receptor [unclassified Nocardioides]KRA38781.1 ABC transporter substrate-binding protein [Nocardioides sp. Root614]KRA92741.1 ABC transporter substrate-binding protein [Nocardioides sp. Root682]